MRKRIMMGRLLGLAAMSLAQAAERAVVRYSPLTQINTKTVGKLTPAWSFSFGGEKLADGLSTAFMVMGARKVHALAAGLPGVGLMTINKRGVVWKSTAFPVAA